MTEKAKQLGNERLVYTEDYQLGGLTKREYFAGLAMKGLLSNPERYKYIAKCIELGNVNQEGASKKNAHKAVLLSDALLEELTKGGKV